MCDDDYFYHIVVETINNAVITHYSFSEHRIVVFRDDSSGFGKISCFFYSGNDPLGEDCSVPFRITSYVFTDIFKTLRGIG